MMYLAFIAGVIGVLGYIPYIRDILKGTTLPDRASWLIWLLQYTALFIAQVNAGGRDSLWLIGFQLLGVICICALSYKYGVGGINRQSTLILGAVCAVLAVWFFTNNAAIAIILLLAVEMSGVILTARKVYMKPGTETLTMWLCVSIAGALSIVALGTSATAILYLYPAALILMGLSVILASRAGAKREPSLSTQE
jgi:hypothetical protein